MSVLSSYLVSGLTVLLADTVYICKTTHEDYIHSKGLENMANMEEYRKDIVAGGLGDILWKREHQYFVCAVGGITSDLTSRIRRAGDEYGHRQNRRPVARLVQQAQKPGCKDLRLPQGPR